MKARFNKFLKIVLIQVIKQIKLTYGWGGVVGVNIERD